MNPGEGGLAVAVAPDDADPVALAHPDGHAVEYGTRAVHLGDGFDGDELTATVLRSCGAGVQADMPTTPPA